MMATIPEELLIDFRELIGEHSGENMAAALWETLTQYGLIGRVSFFAIMFIQLPINGSAKIIAIVTDNAMNNDTMMTAIERRCKEAGVYFSSREARLRCMPHTVHLAAIKVCGLPPAGVYLSGSVLYCINSSLKGSVHSPRLTARKRHHGAAITKTTPCHL